jgi:hypothetical protein
LFHFHGDQKSIALPAHGFDKARFLRIVVEGPPDFSNRGIQAVLEVDKYISGPEMPLQLFPRNYFVRVLQEQEQRLQGARLQWDANAMLAQLSGAGIHFKDAKSQFRSDRPGIVPQMSHANVPSSFAGEPIISEPRLPSMAQGMLSTASTVTQSYSQNHRSFIASLERFAALSPQEVGPIMNLPGLILNSNTQGG